MNINTIYLLTGAAGFLGINICTQLIERGEHIRAFVLKGDPARKYLPAEVEVFEGDLCSAEDCEAFFNIPEGSQSVCIHCASMVTIDPGYSVSSTGVIPELPAGQPIREVNQFVPYEEEKVVGWYSRSKAMATQKVLDAAHAGLNACVVHPSGIIGPNDPAIGQTTRTLTQILNGEMPIGMAGSFNMVDVRDLAAGTIAAADKGRKGECYILSNDEVTLKEMCRMLKEDTGCKGCKFYLPLSFAHLAAKQMEKSAAKKGTKPVLTEFAVYNLERNNAFDCSKAMNELGFAPRPYAETLHDTAAWLKTTGKIH